MHAVVSECATNRRIASTPRRLIPFLSPYGIRSCWCVSYSSQLLQEWKLSCLPLVCLREVQALKCNARALIERLAAIHMSGEPTFKKSLRSYLFSPLMTTGLLQPFPLSCQPFPRSTQQLVSLREFNANRPSPVHLLNAVDPRINLGVPWSLMGRTVSPDQLHSWSPQKAHPGEGRALPQAGEDIQVKFMVLPLSTSMGSLQLTGGELDNLSI